MSQSIFSSDIKHGSALSAIAALILGIIAVSFAAIFIRLSEQEIGPYATVAHRFWMATVALTIWEGGQHLRKPRDTIEAIVLTPLDWSLLLLAGLLTGIDLCLWALSLTQTSVANAAALGNFAPLFTALGSWILWKKEFERRYWIGLVVAFAGALTIGLSDLQVGDWQGDAIALFSALLFSAYLLTLEKLREKLSATTILLSCSLVASGVSSAIALGLEDQFFPTSREGWAAAIGLALVSQTLGQGLVTYSLEKLSSGIVAMTFLLEPAIAEAKRSNRPILFMSAASQCSGVPGVF